MHLTLVAGSFSGKNKRAGHGGGEGRGELRCAFRKEVSLK